MIAHVDTTELRALADCVAHVDSPLSKIVYAAAEELERLRAQLDNSRQYKQQLSFAKEQHAEDMGRLRASLRKLVVEVDFVISGGDNLDEQCTECSLAGIGMLRDARRDAVELLKEIVQ